MTYPPVRYQGNKGEVSAVYRPADHEPDLSNPNGTRVHYLATGASTNGEYGLYRWDFGPEPSGPAPHFHRSISESFFILAGSVRIYDGTRWIDTAPGDFVHVPQGGIHAFRNESGQPASMLLHFAPGAPREAYFEGIRDLDGKSEEERAEFFLRHDNIWL
ncbi:cupin domain-containing protein [Planosporangium mesophilum]|uniref:Cupin n=1 Tax=Planosporangium mesophilum TaxID=689768 RepID=A0A8J3TBC3_9ACTN|nr:cupin domain-containing protein [Planosporangium mesophilum]NJC82979.1 cupin domain-containing protein [Planosporangium mesophilum]GII22381.1 cupin [Planosporangium mesophilum]